RALAGPVGRVRRALERLGGERAIDLADHRRGRLAGGWLLVRLRALRRLRFLSLVEAGQVLRDRNRLVLRRVERLDLLPVERLHDDFAGFLVADDPTCLRAYCVGGLGYGGARLWYRRNLPPR